MTSHSGNNKQELGLASLSDRLRNALAYDGGNKPDFRELDLGSPISPLRTRTGGGPAAAATTSSSSGELSAESSPSAIRNFKAGHTRSDSTGSGSVTSPAVNLLPTGNICPSGKILKTGISSRPTKLEVFGSGSVNYGHGSIIRGGGTPKPALKGGPTNPEDFKRLGNDSYKKGNFAEALSLYDKAIALSPGNAAYRFNRSAALMGLNRLTEAARECEEAVRLDPGYTRAHQRLGSLLLSLGLTENARKHICFPGLQPDSAELHKLQRIDKHLIKCADSRRVSDWRSTLREVDAAIASGANASPQLWACKAEALLKLHRLEDAFLAMSNVPMISHFQHKIFEMLLEAYLHFVRTQIELAMGKFDSALTAIEKAGEMDPHNVEISILLKNVRLVSRARARGNDLFKSERFTEACSAYGEGLRLDPTNSVLYCNRAACWFKLGKWERSVDDCNQALRIQPGYTKALLRRAASNCKMERWNETVRDYEVLRKELPDNNEVAESLLNAQVALKKSLGEC